MESPQQAEVRRSEVADLALALGGFDVRDEDLVLEPAPRIGCAPDAPRTARYVGVDGEGRAILALVGAGDEAVLLAIDALAWCDSHGDLLARRIRADESLATCVVLVLEDPTDATLSALAALRTSDLRVLVARHVRSARSGSGDLVEVRRGLRTDSTIPGATWDADLDPAARGFVDRVLAGLPRIDPEARAVGAARSIVWRSGQVALVQLRASRGRLEAEAGGERFWIDGEGDVERVLSGALASYLALDPDAVDAAEEREIVHQRTSLMPSGPLLSADELAVLRGDA